MARWRVGPVRVGGGRKASVHFGVGPFGVTVGGKRKRGSSPDPDYGDFERDPVTPGEMARVHFGNVSFKLWVGMFFALEVFLLVTCFVVSTFTPRLYMFLAVLNIFISVKLFLTWFQFRRAQKSESPSKSALQSLEKVENGYNPKSIPVLGSFISYRDTERERIQQLEEFEGVTNLNRLQSRKITRVSFRWTIFINFVLSVMWFLSFRLALGVVNKDLSLLREKDFKKKGTLGKSLQELEEYWQTLQGPLTLLYVAIAISFALVLLTAKIPKFSINQSRST
jgi:hypothetical protein